MHVYCSGIGGVGIGPLALLALDAGYKVSGSDLQTGEMAKLVSSRGADVQIGQDGSQIARAHASSPIDWFIYSSALPDDHPELVFARQNHIPNAKRDEFINKFLDAHNLDMLAVAGTHGKTTTTGMLIWLFQQSGIPVSYSIGTTISFGPPAQYQKDSRFFVYECDEFDRNFLHYKPYMSTIVSVDYDHVDTYPTRDSYNYAFSDFIGQSSRVQMWHDDAERLSVTSSAGIEIQEESDPGISQIKLAGEHTRRNAWLACQTFHELFPETDLSQLIETVSKFPGTNRRFEKLSENFYTDYAHHPTEISATINAAQELNKNVVVVYQPHQNVRQHELISEGGYGATFVGAKHVYWLPTYLSREHKDLATLAPSDLIASTTNKANITEAVMNDALASAIKQHIADGDLVIGMSAGDLDTWLRKIVAF